MKISCADFLQIGPYFQSSEPDGLIWQVSARDGNAAFGIGNAVGQDREMLLGLEYFYKSSAPRESSVIRLATFALLASVTCGLSHAQSPVPAGEASSTIPLQLALGGARQEGMPVPVGEATPTKRDSSGDVPIPVSGAVAVAARFPSEKELTGWLNRQSARKLRLQAILITGSSKNLFVWISHPGIDQHIVVPASQINNPDDLQSILKTHPQATVIGLVSINNDRFLVLRNNP